MSTFAISILFNDSRMTKFFMNSEAKGSASELTPFPEAELLSILKAMEYARIGSFSDSFSEYATFLKSQGLVTEDNKVDISKLESSCSDSNLKGLLFLNVWKSLLQVLCLGADDKDMLREALTKLNSSEFPNLFPSYKSHAHLLAGSSSTPDVKAEPVESPINISFDQTQSNITLSLSHQNNKKWPRQNFQIQSSNQILTLTHDQTLLLSLKLSHDTEAGPLNFSLSRNDALLKVTIPKKTNSQIWSHLCAEERKATPSVLNSKLRKTIFSSLNNVQVALETSLVNAKYEFGSKPPSYPTSHKVKKNWDQILLEEEKKIEEGKENSGDNTLKFFQEIYKNADEDSRRAMMKSFATSNGTVLSTNWGEVKNKDYEGKDKVQPPEGQEFKKFES